MHPSYYCYRDYNFGCIIIVYIYIRVFGIYCNEGSFIGNIENIFLYNFFEIWYKIYNILSVWGQECIRSLPSDRSHSILMPESTTEFQWILQNIMWYFNVKIMVHKRSLCSLLKLGFQRFLRIMYDVTM